MSCPSIPSTSGCNCKARLERRRRQTNFPGSQAASGGAASLSWEESMGVGRGGGGGVLISRRSSEAESWEKGKQSGGWEEGLSTARWPHVPSEQTGKEGALYLGPRVRRQSPAHPQRFISPLRGQLHHPLSRPPSVERRGSKSDSLPGSVDSGRYETNSFPSFLHPCLLRPNHSHRHSFIHRHSALSDRRRAPLCIISSLPRPLLVASP